MEHFVYANPAVYRDKLVRFLTLNHTNYSDVSLVSLCDIIIYCVCSVPLTDDQFVCVGGAQGDSITRTEKTK